MLRRRSIAIKRFWSTSPMQEMGHIRACSADRDGSASKSEASKRSYYTWPEQALFYERSFKLATLAMESFGRLGREGRDLFDQGAASIVGWTHGSSSTRRCVCKQRY